jgi:putative hydroxymethylpyrimidine transport system ATP-binding protein
MPWNSDPAAIIAENLTLRYAGATIFENLNFTLEAGKITVLLGPSGVGKTSLLRIIAGLEPPESGQVRPSGHVAYMAQNDLLLPWASIIDNVTIGATLRNEPRDTARA